MRPRDDYSWKSIDSAPLNEDVTLQVTDGRGEPYLLVNASRLTAVGWVSSGKGTPLTVTPVKWRHIFPHAAPPYVTSHPPVKIVVSWAACALRPCALVKDQMRPQGGTEKSNTLETPQARCWAIIAGSLTNEVDPPIGHRKSLGMLAAPTEQ
jgi:hypothetical protein